MKTPFIFNVGWSVQAGLILLKCIDKITWSWAKVFIPFEIYAGFIFVYSAYQVYKGAEKAQKKKEERVLEAIRNMNIDDLK